MHANLENGAVLEKTLELCQTLVSQPEFLTLRRHIDTFLADDVAKGLYQAVAEKGEYLNHKQHSGTRLAPEEIADFEQQRDAMVANTVAQAFLEAQQTMQQVQQTVSRYVTKTFELGRVPAPEDFESCGHGCSCH
ncbi:MAG: YlbF family regulator [Verrucomicrobia bacterium]|nr:YlbF family regulator [Verrucomicrobiota bacterium]